MSTPDLVLELVESLLDVAHAHRGGFAGSGVWLRGLDETELLGEEQQVVLILRELAGESRAGRLRAFSEGVFEPQHDGKEGAQLGVRYEERVRDPILRRLRAPGARGRDSDGGLHGLRVRAPPAAAREEGRDDACTEKVR
jgi:hypothetical protein